MNKHFEIRVENEDNDYPAVIDIWHKAERREDLPEAIPVLTFANLEILLRTLTPKRFELLKTLKKNPDAGVNHRRLAVALERDYKNVHTDVAALEQIGLVEKGGDGKLIAPYDVIDAHFNLAA